LKTRGYVLRKLGQTALTTFVVLAFNFFLFRIMPGDPVKILIRNPRISAAALQRITEQFGLNQSKFVQFGYYLRDLCMANMGHSFVYRKPVLDVIMEKIPPTLLLTGTATILSIIIGVVLGVIFAWKRASSMWPGSLYRWCSIRCLPSGSASSW
jgi:peptide/nickel transport system permease protein